MNVRFLTESLASVKHLKSYIDKNCSPKDGWSATKHTPKALLPGNLLKHKFDVIGKESFHYPDGSPSDWFVKRNSQGREILFVFGISPYKDSFACCIFNYLLFPEEKQILLSTRTFMRFTREKLDEDHGKSATQLMKRVMKIASTKQDAVQADEFITRREWFK